mmetsp:Transcript_41421/g.62600  ORF Transcript_41421/g.62600 Transcript_41421/m.62600 type:complete len:119 (+) Transcript_41421:200-556(+)
MSLVGGVSASGLRDTKADAFKTSTWNDIALSESRTVKKSSCGVGCFCLILLLLIFLMLTTGAVVLFLAGDLQHALETLRINAGKAVARWGTSLAHQQGEVDASAVSSTSASSAASSEL